ncbi:uncharacterized protein LOC120261625 [Dioscorea cayenensis subsp. rotundata]|uniref:Uncharacterized protein LOC120261625 n=1 Tax=Dioscorea cayennensis subsp. rotundata TaxID=55577 RepID=A0AB40BDY8_DIOCR|nr:uncharacterized protein LOC120261625 [Dioscorea cayenensis subsp. rotundata]
MTPATARPPSSSSPPPLGSNRRPLLLLRLMSRMFDNHHHCCHVEDFRSRILCCNDLGAWGFLSVTRDSWLFISFEPANPCNFILFNNILHFACIPTANIDREHKVEEALLAFDAEEKRCAELNDSGENSSDEISAYKADFLKRKCMLVD